MGLNSLPVAFGPEVAKWITVATIDVTQLAVAAYLAVGRHETTYAAVLTALILPQVFTAACEASRVQKTPSSTLRPASASLCFLEQVSCGKACAGGHTSGMLSVLMCLHGKCAHMV